MQDKQTDQLVAKIADYQRTFETPHGKKVLYDLMKSACILHSTYSPKSTPYDMAFKEGARNLVLSILVKLNKDVAYLKQAMSDSVKEYTNVDSRQSGASG